MGGWKAGLEGGKDAEADRIDRQKAAFGAETLAKLKDLNILIIGLRGVGVETAKNLILSNVGAVVVCDTAVPEMRDLGSNFYLSEQHVRAGTPRAEACLPQLKSLNPFCKVEAYSGELSDGHVLFFWPDLWPSSFRVTRHDSCAGQVHSVEGRQRNGQALRRGDRHAAAAEGRAFQVRAYMYAYMCVCVCS